MLRVADGASSVLVGVYVADLVNCRFTNADLAGEAERNRDKTPVQLGEIWGRSAFFERISRF